MNEREFGSYAATVLKNIFPTILPAEIKMEHSFSLKFGHHNVIIDGKEPGNYAKRGIYDILLTIQGKPLAILELKKPDIDIDTEDIRQGVSYARLVTPIAPLTIISNGKKTILINTYDSEALTVDSLDMSLIENLFTRALRLSQNELKESVRTLIENDHRIIFNIINTLSASAFEGLTGNFDEVRKPIMREFRVEREAEAKVNEMLLDHNGVVITGDPFIGKTTLLYQLFLNTKKGGDALFYINCTDPGYSLFKKLAAFITREMQYFVEENKIREWLLLGFNRDDKDRLLIVFDHLRFDAEPSLKAEIVEFYDLFLSKNNRLIIATDNSNYDLLTATEGRQVDNFYSKSFQRVKLGAFSKDEFVLANDLLYESFGSGILAGGSFAGEYRSPRIWRLLARATAQNRPTPDVYGVIDAVPSLDFLRLISNTWQFDPQTVQDFQALTEAYLEALPLKDEGGYIKLMAMNLPVIEEHELKRHVDIEVIRRMENTGLIERRLVPGHLWVYLPKIPELIAGFAVAYVHEKFYPELTGDFDNGYPKFMEACQYLPLGEIVATRNIINWAYEGEIELFSKFIDKLKEDKPKINSSSDGMLVRMYLPEKGHIDLPIDPGEEQKFVDNIFPYLVLSHMVALGFVDNSNHPDLERAKCIIAVGETDFFVKPLNVNTFFETIPSFDVGNIGSVVQSDIGIIEPIVQSIQTNIVESPMVVKALFLHAMNNKSYRLFHRIYIAARFTPTLGIAESDDLCEQIKEQYMEHFNKMIAYALAPEGAPRSERRRIERKLQKIRKRKR